MQETACAGALARAWWAGFRRQITATPIENCAILLTKTQMFSFLTMTLRGGCHAL